MNIFQEMTFPTVGDTIQVVVGEGKTEPLLVTPAVYFGANNVIYASKNSGDTWWPIPLLEGGVMSPNQIRFILTGEKEAGKYEDYKHEGAFYMQIFYL